MQQKRLVIGRRIKRLREAKGFSRRELANHLRIDPTAVASWELGKYLPREKKRNRVAHLLGVDVPTLFNGDNDPDSPAVAAALFDTMKHMPEMLIALTNQTRHRIRALRLAAPYSTAAHVQKEWRTLISDRLLSGTLEVQRVEIFYNLKRLQETLANILRYDGREYWVKSYCPGLDEVVPAMGGYFFDDEDFLLGAYWTSGPPHGLPALRLSGDPFRVFFDAYWNAIWQRGTLLNIRGAHDLSAVRAVSLQLGLPPKKWKSFVEEAAELKVGDGVPPLI